MWTANDYSYLNGRLSSFKRFQHLQNLATFLRLNVFQVFMKGRKPNISVLYEFIPNI